MDEEDIGGPPKVDDILDPGDQFRKTKRALFTWSAIAIAIGLAKVGPQFSPQVLGQGVSIETLWIRLGLTAYVTYLWIAFENDRRRAIQLYNRRVYEAGSRQRDPQAAVDRLIEPLTKFNLEFAALLEKIEPARGQIALAQEPVTPSESPLLSEIMSVNSIYFALDDTRQKLMSVRGPEVLEITAILNDLSAAMKVFPERLEADLRLAFDRVRMLANDRGLKSISATQMITEIAENVRSLTIAVERERAEITRLSNAILFRERAMFVVHDVIATRLLAAAALYISILRGIGEAFPSVSSPPDWFFTFLWFAISLVFGSLVAS